MSFAEIARRLMGIAALLLGWRPAEFWAATPGELAAILESWRESADAAAGPRGMDAAELARLTEVCGDGG